LTSENAPFEERYLLILEAFKRLPFTAGDESLVNTVRTTASSLNDDDSGFGALRNSIHGKLSADDADRVSFLRGPLKPHYVSWLISLQLNSRQCSSNGDQVPVNRKNSARWPMPCILCVTT